MKNIKKYIAVAIATIMSASLLAGCNIVKKTPEAISKTVLATVNKEKITRGDLDQLMKADIAQYKQQYGDDYENNDSFKDTLKQNRTDALNYLVEEKVLLQKAKDFGVVPSDDEINSYIDTNVAKYKSYTGGDEAYATYLDSIGYTPDSFKDVLRDQAIIKAAIDYMVKDVSATDQEIQDYYNSNQQSLTVQPGAFVSHLLIPAAATSTATATDSTVATSTAATSTATLTSDQAKALADKARELAVSGKSLQDIAAMDEFKSAGAVYEDLGHKTFDNSGLEASFETAFKALPAGQYSQPVQTSYGWHIILNSKVNTTAGVPALEDIKDQVKDAVENPKKQTEYTNDLEQYKQDMNVKTYTDRF